MADLTTHEHFTNLIKPGRDALEQRRRDYDHAYQVYRPGRPARPRGEWRSMIRNRIGQQVIDTTLVNIVGGAPAALVKPRRPEDMATAPKMRTVLNYHINEDHLVEKQPVFVQQGLIYGVTVAKNQWAYKEVTAPRRRWLDVPLVGRLSVTENQNVVLRDGPTFEPWNVYETGWEPNARDVDSAAYVFLGSWMSKDELLANAVSDRNPYGMFEMAAVEKLLKNGPSTATYTSAQDRRLGAAADKQKDRYHITEIWRETGDGLYCTYLGDDRVTLGDGPTPFWHGKKPVVIAQVRPDLFELQGIGETELLDDLQQAMDTLMNMRFDNIHLTVNRGFTYRESGIQDVNSLVLKPRFMWPVTDHDDVQAINTQPLPPEAYREDELLMGRIQLVTGINPYVSGADMASVDQNTATGVTALQEVASRLLRFKARQIAYKGFKRTFEQWGDLIQQFMTREQAVRIQGSEPDVYDWTEVGPQEIVGNYDYDVEGTEESLSEQQERGEATQLINVFAPLIQAQLVDPKPLYARVAQAYDMDPRELFPPAQPPAPPAAPGNGQPPPGLLDGRAMPPMVGGAIMGGQQM